jgi:hypothetical protein
MLLDCSVQVYNQPRFSASQLSTASAHLGFAVGTVAIQEISRWTEGVSCLFVLQSLFDRAPD